MIEINLDDVSLDSVDVVTVNGVTYRKEIILASNTVEYLESLDYKDLCSWVKANPDSMVYILEFEELFWLDFAFPCVYSGAPNSLKWNYSKRGFGKGPIMRGRWEVKTRNVVVMDELTDITRPYFSLDNGFGFFIPLKALDKHNKPEASNRDGFGIHPDGNIVGSAGCPVFGLPEGCAAFWQKWLILPLDSRPTTLYVLDSHKDD